MKNTPINSSVVSQKIKASGIPNIGRASIREIKRLINEIEKETGQKFVRMEMGVPGLPAVSIGIEAEISALKNGVASVYPEIYGIPELKNEMSRFAKMFLDIQVSPESCVPTVGSMQASFASFLAVNRMHAKKDTVLLIDPGFPVHKQQLRLLNEKMVSFDVYNFRGEKLKEKIESYLKQGNISTIMYSNPNNPSWICFKDQEIKIIADLANQYDCVVLEDLAYFAMDFRHDLSQPGKTPFQPTVAKYTDNYILLFSSSKAFSYAGQRIAMMLISDKLYTKQLPDLKRFYDTDRFGHAMVFGTIYPLSAGTAHSPQYALAAILKAANDGTYNFVKEVREYGEKAKIMKKLFTDNGFKIVYDKDVDEPIADGFYFTLSYPGFTGEQLVEELLYYGISAISLSITGSERAEGLRACVSLVKREQFKDLESRLKQFNQDHKNF